MMVASPLVSIVIPTFRRPHLVLDAVRSALAQPSGLVAEVLVLENPEPGRRPGEMTETARLLRGVNDPRVAYARNGTDLGMTGNWNEGLRRARGEWVVLLHDDDSLSREFVGAGLAAARRFPGAVAVGCERRVWREGIPEPGGEAPDGIRRLRARRLAAEDFLLGNPYPAMSGVIFRREAALEAGGFDDGFFPSADFAMWQTLALSGSALKLDAPLVNYGISANESRRSETIVKMARADLRLRDELVSRCFRPGRPLSLFSRYKVLDSVRGLGRFWGTDVDLSQIYDDVGLRRLPDRAAAQLAFRAVRRVLIARRALRRWTPVEIPDALAAAPRP